MSGESPLPGLQTAVFLLHPYMTERIIIFHGSSYRGTSPIHETSILMTKLPPKGPTSKYYCTGDEGLHLGIWRKHKYSDQSTVLKNNEAKHCCWKGFLEVESEPSLTLKLDEHFHLALVVLKCWPCLFKRIFEILTK